MLAFHVIQHFFFPFQATNGSHQLIGSPYSKEKQKHRSYHAAKDLVIPAISMITKKRHCVYPQRRSVLKSSQSSKFSHTSFLLWFFATTTNIKEEKGQLCVRARIALPLPHNNNHHRVEKKIGVSALGLERLGRLIIIIGSSVFVSTLCSVHPSHVRAAVQEKKGYIEHQKDF